MLQGLGLHLGIGGRSQKIHILAGKLLWLRIYCCKNIYQELIAVLNFGSCNFDLRVIKLKICEILVMLADNEKLTSLIKLIYLQFIIYVDFRFTYPADFGITIF